MRSKILENISDKTLYASIAATNISPKQKLRNVAAWGYKTMRGLNENPGDLSLAKKVVRHAALTAISYYVGDLRGKEQTKIARRLGVPDETFSKYDTAVIYPICSAPQIAGLIASRIAGVQEGEKAALANLIPGAGINLVRGYLAFVRKKPSVSVCAKALATNAAHYAPRIKKTIKELTQTIKEKGIKEVTNYAGKKMAEVANREILAPLNATTEIIAEKSYGALQDAKIEFNTAFAPRVSLEDHLKF